MKVLQTGNSTKELTVVSMMRTTPTRCQSLHPVKYPTVKPLLTNTLMSYHMIGIHYPNTTALTVAFTSQTQWSSACIRTVAAGSAMAKV
jgi:hypothetical protein